MLLGPTLPEPPYRIRIAPQLTVPSVECGFHGPRNDECWEKARFTQA